MHLLNPLESDYSRLTSIFEKIQSRNAIAFLGAGASVSNKQFLSKDVINAYEGKISRNFGTTDIVKFVDILQNTDGLSRSDFDNFVIEQLRKLHPNTGHKIMSTIPWKQIVTTNYDTLLEEAWDDSLRDRDTHFSLKKIKNKKQFESLSSNNEVQYIKLNGCKTDLSEYPLVFSTEDFKRQMPFYHKVLAPFKQLSSDIIFIAFGYSFSDEFAEKLLEKIDDSDFRQKRTLFCVDPFINNDILTYLASKNIAVIKLSFEVFFQEYKKWFINTNKSYYNSLQRFTNPDSTQIKIDITTRLYLDSDIIQLKDDYRFGDKLRKQEFYYGAEPTYQVVNDNYDIIKKIETNRLIKEFENAFQEETSTSIPKLIIVKGDFGSGKTTFTLRAIKEFLKTNNSTLAFEIIKPHGLRKNSLSKLITDSLATQFIFYSDNIEADSIFKAFNELRVELATEQYSNIAILFISSIRENILERYKSNAKMTIKNCKEFEYTANYSKEELTELVDNLKEFGVVDFRDKIQKDSIIFDLQSKYKGDSFMTLYSLVSKGAHYKYLVKAYEELMPDIKMAFKITALIHRFNMLCPVSLIKNSLKISDWSIFTEQVIKSDGKGILFQEKRNSSGSDPDLYFKTKHPVIADALVKNIIKEREKNSLYKSIFTSLSFSEYNARFVIDLIKNIRSLDKDVTTGQINNFFEITKPVFQISSHYLIGYVSNVEKTSNSIHQLKKCIEDIEILESEIQKPIHRLIHRKGCVYFKIARIAHHEHYETEVVLNYLDEAEDWFIIKKQKDPTSHYSYVDYLNMLFWKIKNYDLGNELEMDVHLKINSLIDEAYKTLYNDTQIISEFQQLYKTHFNIKETNSEYLEMLMERYSDVNSRPIACILLFYYYDERRAVKKCTDLINEMVSYTDNRDIVYFLFKYFGRNLHRLEYRNSFFDLVRNNEFLKERYEMRYLYFTAINEFYSWKWQVGRDYLQQLKVYRQNNINTEFFLYWKNNNGEVEIFKAEIYLDKKVKKVKIVDPFYKEFLLVKGNYNDISDGDKVDVKLRFMFEGILAEIID